LEYIERYRARLEALREAQWVKDMKIEMMALESWHCFSLATLSALQVSSSSSNMRVSSSSYNMALLLPRHPVRTAGVLLLI
jgi:hypothetical protein